MKYFIFPLGTKSTLDFINAGLSGKLISSGMSTLKLIACLSSSRWSEHSPQATGETADPPQVTGVFPDSPDLCLPFLFTFDILRAALSHVLVTAGPPRRDLQSQLFAVLSMSGQPLIAV